MFVLFNDAYCHNAELGIAGDEESSIEIKIFRDGKHFIAMNLLIDDTTRLPTPLITPFSHLHWTQIYHHIYIRSWNPCLIYLQSLLWILSRIFWPNWLSHFLKDNIYIPEDNAPLRQEQEQDDKAESDEQRDYDDNFNFIDCGPTRLVAQSSFPTLLREYVHDILLLRLCSLIAGLVIFMRLLNLDSNLGCDKTC
jgi:hypothetical protein